VRGRIQVIKGDITTLEVDAIVNAANSSLLGGGGVDGAIHRAAGPDLLKECRLLGGCKTGQAKITGGYKLPAKYVIHTVGPIWRGGNAGEPTLLASCYNSCLNLAMEHGVKRIAFPAISCGVYGYPANEAARIAIRTTIEYLMRNAAVEEVKFVCFEQGVFQAYREALQEVSDKLDPEQI
jgi:O-acetyl-ADP-ribose deacetylase